MKVLKTRVTRVLLGSWYSSMNRNSRWHVSASLSLFHLNFLQSFRILHLSLTSLIPSSIIPGLISLRPHLSCASLISFVTFSRPPEFLVSPTSFVSHKICWSCFRWWELAARSLKLRRLHKNIQEFSRILLWGTHHHSQPENICKIDI